MFTNLVHLFKTAQDAAERAYGSVLAAEKEAFADLGGGYTAMNTRSSYAAERELQEFCSRLVGRLVMEASRKFAPRSGRLDIDKDAELKRFGLNVGKVLEARKLPDLDGFWQHLEKTYSGDAGREVAFSQAARAIIDGFWLKPDSQIKRTSSAAVLEKRVSSEVSFRSSGKRRIHYGSTQNLALMRRALRWNRKGVLKVEYFHLPGSIDVYQDQMVAHKRDATRAGLDWTTPELEDETLLHMDSLLDRFVDDLALLADATAGEMRKLLKEAA